MLRPRKDPDPIEGKRRQLEAQERLLAQQMSRLSDQLNRGSQGLDGDAPKVPEPPVWRLEEDGQNPRSLAKPSAQQKRNLARQRQRDMIIFFIMIAALIIVVIMFMALMHNHEQPTNV